MVLDLILGFLVLVAASYLGTTMALRGFFGRERHDPDGERRGGGPPGTDDVPRASDESEGRAE